MFLNRDPKIVHGTLSRDEENEVGNATSVAMC